MKDIDLYAQGIEKGAENVQKILLSRFTILKNSPIKSNPTSEQEDAILVQSQKDDECRIIIDLLRYLEEIKSSCINTLQSQASHQQKISTLNPSITPASSPIQSFPGDTTYASFIEYISCKEFSIIRNGYDKQEVDTFLDRICDTLDCFDGKKISGLIVSIQEIENMTFSRENMGYDCKEVDALLREITSRYPYGN